MTTGYSADTVSDAAFDFLSDEGPRLAPTENPKSKLRHRRGIGPYGRMRLTEGFFNSLRKPADRNRQ